MKSIMSLGLLGLVLVGCVSVKPAPQAAVPVAPKPSGFLDPQPPGLPRPMRRPLPPLSWEQRELARQRYGLNLNDALWGGFDKKYAVVDGQRYDFDAVSPYMAASGYPDLARDFKFGAALDDAAEITAFTAALPLLAMLALDEKGKQGAVAVSVSLLTVSLSLDVWGWWKRLLSAANFDAAVRNDLKEVARNGRVDPVTGKPVDVDLPPALGAGKPLGGTALDWYLQLEPFTVGSRRYDEIYVPYFLVQSGREDLLPAYRRAEDHAFWASTLLLTGVLGVCGVASSFLWTPSEENHNARVGMMLGSGVLGATGFIWYQEGVKPQYLAIEKSFNDGLKLRWTRKF